MPSAESEPASRDKSSDRRNVSFNVQSTELSSSSTPKRPEDDIPLSFASFYYSLKVSKGKDEREDVQKKTFAKWINFQLAKVREPPVKDLFHDLRDGTKLLKLLELLTGRELKKEVGNMKVHHLANLNFVLSTLRDYKIRLINISANDIYDGNPKLTLGLVWNIIQHWQVRDVLRTSVHDIHATNLEKALLKWCQNSTKGYPGVDIKDFTSSWKDGLAFNALIHRYRPNLVNYDELLDDKTRRGDSREFAERSLENAFDVAHRSLQIDRLLDVEDVITDLPDKKSIMMYVMCYFQVLSKPQVIIDDMDSNEMVLRFRRLTPVSVHRIDKSVLTTSLSLNEFDRQHSKQLPSKSDKCTLTPSYSLTNLQQLQQANTSNQLESQDLVNELNKKNSSSLVQRVPPVLNESTKTTLTTQTTTTTTTTTVHSSLSQLSIQQSTTLFTNKKMASSDSSSANAVTAPTSSPVLDNYLQDLKKVVDWLSASSSSLTNQPEIGHDVNQVKQQFQTHEDFMLELTKHQNNVGMVLQEGSRIINSGTVTSDDDAEIRKQMKLLNDMWEGLRMQAVERQSSLHERLMKLQNEQLSQMDQWLANTESRIHKISQLADSLDGLIEQKEELARLQDDLVKEQEAVDCLKQIIVVVDDNSNDQTFTDLETKLASLSDRWSSVCKFVGNRWFITQDLILKLQSIETDFGNLNKWISNKSIDLNNLIRRVKPLAEKNKIAVNDAKFNKTESSVPSDYIDVYDSVDISSSIQLIKILKEVEHDMQAMHSKLNDMNEIGEQIGTHLHNSPNLNASINNKMDVLEFKWNHLLEQMEYLSKVCTELQQVEIKQNKKQTLSDEMDSDNSSSNKSAASQHANKRRRMHTDEIKEYTSIESFVTQINKSLDTLRALLAPIEDLSLDAQQEVIKKAQLEVQNNEILVEDMNLIAHNLKQNMKSGNQDYGELESTVHSLNKKWSTARSHLDELSRTIERNCMMRKAQDEIATLRDVHEGYQKYIVNAEPISNDAQKLNTQLETNKVKLKGMNSYEPRLSELKSLAIRINNKELTVDMDTLASKWQETYSQINERQKTLNVEEETRNFRDLKQVMIEWLIKTEKSLQDDEIRLNFLPELEDQQQKYRDLHILIKEKKVYMDQIQQELDSLYTRSLSINQDLVTSQMRNDMKQLRTRYQNLNETVVERQVRLDRMVNDLRRFHDEYVKTLNLLNRIETNLQIEHHSSTPFGASYGKTLEEQLSNLKQVKYDLESLNSNVSRLNELAQKLLGTPNAHIKFCAKLRSDISDLNEKLNQLKSMQLKKQYSLEEALSKSNKVDSELDDIENWITYKDHEILEDEGVIITEEQFDQRVIKYKQIKAEIERKESQVKKALDAGNEMLKSSSNNLANINELARNLNNISTKWTSLNKKIDSKNRLFAQLSDIINELRQLLHQENSWLEKAQQKLNSSKVGADAEELSEELDSLERFLKAHTHQTKERIGELSAQLVEKNILIQLANSDVKEFLFKWHLIHEEASRKLQTLDSAINDVQNWERRLIELQDWCLYMDKYLSTRIDQDIFADDVPDDFARIQDEFARNELILKELEEGVEKYRACGKLDSATRLDQQLTLMQRSWTDLQHKLRKFQKPADFDQKLNKVRKQLDEIEQVLHMIDINCEDSDTIHMQLEHCMKFYKTLSELKSQIEIVLKQGRSIVDKKQVDHTEELTRQLDTLKLKYNEMGSRVTNSKNDLEKAFKLAKRFRKEYNLINDFLSKIDGELRKIEQKPLSKNYNDELDWIKNTKSEINKVETINLETMRGLRKSLDDIVRSQTTNSISKLNGTTVKINEIEQKVSNILRRVDDRAGFLHEQAKKLDESYETYFAKSRCILTQIDVFQNELIEAERLGSRDLLDRIEKELNTFLNDIENIKLLGTDLCSKSEQYCKSVEADLHSLIINYENLMKRLELAHERLCCAESAAAKQQECVETVRRTKQSESYRAVNRRAKSPSESSMDSTFDMLDSELKQKYMRAVAYLRLLDESFIPESGDEYGDSASPSHGFKYRSPHIDIDYVIQQARHVAKIYEDSDPDRSRRILEKVYKLEKRWSEAKNKKDTFRSSSKLFEQYAERDGTLKNNIHVIESVYSCKDTSQDENDTVLKLKRALRDIEALYIEETILNEFVRQQGANSIEDIKHNNKAQSHLDTWRKFADNWKDRDDEVKQLISEADCFFAQINTTTPMSSPEKKSINLLSANKSAGGDEMSKSIAELSSEIASNEKNIQNNSLISEPAEFSKCIEKLIVSTRTVDKHLDNIQKPNKEFVEFEKQDLKLNAIKQTLESLAVALKTCLIHKRAIMDKSGPEAARAMSKSIAELMNLHQNVVNRYKEKNAVYLKNYEKWVEFNKDYQSMNAWLDATLSKLEKINSADSELTKLNDVIKDFNNLTSYRLLLERANLNGHEILVRSSEHDTLKIDLKLESLSSKWKSLVSLLTQLREKLVLKNNAASQDENTSNDTVKSDKQPGTSVLTTDSIQAQSPFQVLLKRFNDEQEWLRKCEKLIDKKKVSPVDELEMERYIFELKEFQTDLPNRESIFQSDLKQLKPQLATLSECDSACQRSTEILEKFAQIKEQLPARREELESSVIKYKQFQEDLNTMFNWINNIHLDLVNATSGIIQTKTRSPDATPRATTPQDQAINSKDSPSSDSSSTSNLLLDSDAIRTALSSKANEFNQLRERYAFYSTGQPKMHSFLSSKMDNLKKRWNELEIGTALGDSIGLSSTPPPQAHSTSNMPASSPSTSSSVSSQQSAVSARKPITAQSKPSFALPTTSSKTDQQQIKRPEEVGEAKKAPEPLQPTKKDLSNLSSGSSTTTSSYHQSHHDDEEASIQEEEDVDFDVPLNEAKNEEEIIQSASSSPILFEKIERPQAQARTSLRDETRDPKQDQNQLPYEESPDELANIAEIKSKQSSIVDDKKVLSLLNDDAYFMLNSNAITKKKIEPTEYLKNDKINKIYKKTDSLDSIKSSASLKSKTIVTPVDLEPDEQLTQEVNIMKLEAEVAGPEEVDDDDEEIDNNNEDEDVNIVQSEASDSPLPSEKYEEPQVEQKVEKQIVEYERKEEPVAVVEDEYNDDEIFKMLDKQDEHQSISILASDLSSNHKKKLSISSIKDLNGANSVVNGGSTTAAAAAVIVKDDNELALNDLFDWLLWIDHNLQTQVTVGNAEEITQSISKYESILSEFDKKQEKLDTLKSLIMSGESKPELADKLAKLNSQWIEGKNKVESRHKDLQTMLSDCNYLESIGSQFSDKLNDIEQKMDSLKEISFGSDTLKRQKTEHKNLKIEFGQLKQSFEEIKSKNAELVSKYEKQDECSKFKIKQDRLVSRYNELSNRLMMRGDNIDEVLQAIDDFDGQLQSFSQWLYKIEQDLNYLEDYCLKSEDTNSTKQTVIELYQRAMARLLKLDYHF